MPVIATEKLLCTAIVPGRGEPLPYKAVPQAQKAPLGDQGELSKIFDF